MADERTSAHADFERLAAMPDEDIDLAVAALAIATDEYPDLDAGESLAILDALADQARPRVELARTERDRLRALTGFLHEEVGFRGNLDAYYDPRNSYLNDVLSRGLGIPITLGVVFIEVGRRLGVRLSGVNFPGHFLLRAEAGGPVYVDPFDPCRLMCAADCEQLLAVMSEGRIRFEPRFLEPASARQILVRMLSNLKLVHFRSGSYARAVTAIDRILLLCPGQAVEYRDRGLAHLKLEDHQAAFDDLSRYLELADEPSDRCAVQAALDSLRPRLPPLN